VNSPGNEEQSEIAVGYSLVVTAKGHDPVEAAEDVRVDHVSDLGR
jgi:hypothetical protein